MTTPMLKRQLNPFLLASTVLVLSLLAGMSVLYQGQLSNIVSEKKDLNDTITEKSQRINELQNTNDRLSKTVDTLQSDRGSLQNQLSDKETTISTLNSQVDSLNSEVNSLENDLDQKNQEISQLETQNQELQDDLDLLNITLGDICEDNDNNLTSSSENDCEDAGWNP